VRLFHECPLEIKPWELLWDAIVEFVRCTRTFSSRTPKNNTAYVLRHEFGEWTGENRSRAIVPPIEINHNAGLFKQVIRHPPYGGGRSLGG